MIHRYLAPTHLLMALAAAAILMPGLATAKPQGGPRATITVAKFNLKADFEAVYGPTDVGGGLTSMLTTALSESDRFLVVERGLISDVFSEQELTAAGLVSPEAAATPGQLIGAQLLVVGSITEFSEAESGKGFSIGIGGLGNKKKFGIGVAPQKRKGTVGMDVRVIDSTTSRVITSFSVREQVKARSVGLQLMVKDISVAQKTFEATAVGKAARKAIEKAVERIVKAAAKTPWSGRVVDVEQNEVVFNAGEHAGVKVGERFKVFRVTKLLKDPATGRILGQRKKQIGDVEVEKVTDSLAFARFMPVGVERPNRDDLISL